MGQGSHTAMPVYAYFMEKVLKDPSLSRYRGKISDKPDVPIEGRSWNCRTVLSPDTAVNDSTIADIVGVKIEKIVDEDADSIG